MCYQRASILLAGLAFLTACQDYPVESSIDDGPQGTIVEGFTSPGEIRSGWIVGPEGDPVEVTFEVHRGRAIFEGDIDLGPVAAIPLSRDSLPQFDGEKAIQRGVVRDDRAWSSPVHYTISSSFNSTQRQVISQALSHIANSGPDIWFREGSSSSYIHFVLDSEGCFSPVGRQGGRQDIHLTSGCAGSMGHVVHEILHSLRFWHEQSRCDRNSYVEILWQNIKSGKEDNFEQKCLNATDVRSYDEGSIMHYGPRYFGKEVNGVPQQTIRSLRGREYQMGQRNGLSSTDVSTLGYLFGHPPADYIDGPAYPPAHTQQTWTAKRGDGASLQSVTWYRDRQVVANTFSYTGCTGGSMFELLVDMTDVYGRFSQAVKYVYPDLNTNAYPSC